MNGANTNGNGESIYRSYEVNELPINEWCKHQRRPLIRQVESSSVDRAAFAISFHNFDHLRQI